MSRRACWGRHSPRRWLVRGRTGHLRICAGLSSSLYNSGFQPCGQTTLQNDSIAELQCFRDISLYLQVIDPRQARSFTDASERSVQVAKHLGKSYTTKESLKRQVLTSVVNRNAAAVMYIVIPYHVPSAHHQSSRKSSRKSSLALTSTELHSHALLSATCRVRVALLAEVLLCHKSAYIHSIQSLQTHTS
jgi:hypothetical protein